MSYHEDRPWKSPERKRATGSGVKVLAGLVAVALWVILTTQHSVALGLIIPGLAVGLWGVSWISNRAQAHRGERPQRVDPPDEG